MIKLRELCSDDVNFVIKAFIRNYYANAQGKKPKADLFYQNHSEQLKALHADGKIFCVIACSSDDPALIFGFAIFGIDRTLHYVLVKESYQRLGIASKLIAHIIKDRKEIVISHFTKDINYFKEKYKLIYNPYKYFQ